MPRPSVKTERKEQILDAYEACVARFGVEGASLEKIAKEAGLARPLIRHHVGNRDDLLDALVERFLRRSDISIDQMLKALPKTDTATVLIDLLFDPKFSNTQTVLVAESLIAAAQDNKMIAKKMRRWTKTFIKSIANVLTHSFPKTSEQKIHIVAVGVTGIYFNADSLTPLGNMTDIHTSSREAARLLLSTLGDSR